MWHLLIFKCCYLLIVPDSNSVRPSDAIWWHGSSTLAHVMACYPTAPSHYLNQCWLIIKMSVPFSEQFQCLWTYSVIYVRRLHFLLQSHLPKANALNQSWLILYILLTRLSQEGTEHEWNTNRKGEHIVTHEDHNGPHRLATCTPHHAHTHTLDKEGKPLWNLTPVAPFTNMV